ncbi:hypothetical protein, partial [Streptomyces hirsutus]|uniref:hypothetical protein n=1 Tax=Streptomyces hirsutus TaxID=35620 RepID=UPI000A4848A7
LGVAPLSHGALNARLARRALATVLAGEPLPASWMEEIIAPGEDEQPTYTKLLTALGDYRRHHRAGPDLLGPRPIGRDGEEWDYLTDAIDLHTHARVQHCLEDLRTRTALLNPRWWEALRIGDRAGSLASRVQPQNGGVSVGSIRWAVVSKVRRECRFHGRNCGEPLTVGAGDSWRRGRRSKWPCCLTVWTGTVSLGSHGSRAPAPCLLCSPGSRVAQRA